MDPHQRNAWMTIKSQWQLIRAHCMNIMDELSNTAYANSADADASAQMNTAQNIINVCDVKIAHVNNTLTEGDG